ncbi:MAG: hypothetical protein K2X50_09515 [Gammaproteobacteria bacterium]|nr:hypothetical protein [Gammaproteobacteria bacterium]
MSSKHALTVAEQLKENFDAICADDMQTLNREIKETEAFLASLSSRSMSRGSKPAVINTDPDPSFVPTKK